MSQPIRVEGWAYTPGVRRAGGHTSLRRLPRPPGSHRRIREKYNLNFPLFTDEGGRVAEALGVLRENREKANRVTFLLDPSAKIAKVYPDVSPETHADEIINSGLQCSCTAPICRCIAAIELFPNVRYVLFITDNPLGKAEGEEAWKTLKDPLQANTQHLNESSVSALVFGARRRY